MTATKPPTPQGISRLLGAKYPKAVTKLHGGRSGFTLKGTGPGIVHVAHGPRPGKVHFAGEQDESTACGRDMTGPVTRLPEVTLIISAVTCARCRQVIPAAERTLRAKLEKGDL